MIIELAIRDILLVSNPPILFLVLRVAFDLCLLLAAYKVEYVLAKLWEKCRRSN